MANPSVPRMADARRAGHDRSRANKARSLCSSLSLLALYGALAACNSTKTVATPADPGPLAGKAPLALVGSAWDNFNHRGNVMWACRDLASGDIVSTSMCHGLVKDDRHWPGMAVPPSFRGMPDP